VEGITAIIPARAGSKGVAKKNIRLLGGHPLLAYTIAAAQLSSLIEDIVVTTDSQEIAGIAHQYGARTPFLRPAEISRDDSLDIEFVNHFLKFLTSQGLPYPDLLVHLRPTTPLRDVALIDGAIRAIQEDTEATSLRSMERVAITPYKLFHKEDGYAKAYLALPDCIESSNLPRQAFPPTYDPNGVVDIVRPQVVSETGTLHGARMLLWECPNVADIDTEEDFAHAEQLLHDARFSPLLRYVDQEARRR